MGYDATALGAYMGVHLTIQLFMLVMLGPYVFSGRGEDLDLLLLKAATGFSPEDQGPYFACIL
jgi:hypothetical protein